MLKTKKGKRLDVFFTVLFVLLLLYALSIFFVLGWGLMTSFKTYKEFEMPLKNVTGLPRNWTFENYSLVFKYISVEVTKAQTSYYSNGQLVVGKAGTVGFFGLIYNTLLYSVVGALLKTIVPAVVGYICAKYKWALTKIIYTVMLFVMSLPIVGAYPSELTVLRNLGIYDTMWGNWLQKFNFTGMYFFVFVAHFSSVPDTYREAAEIDGASQFTIMVRIMLPLAVKTMSTVWLIQFIQLWNDYQTMLLYLPSWPTLAYSVWKMVISTDKPSPELNHVPPKVAACTILASPTIVIFIALKEKIMGNISMGGIKQ